MDYRNIIKRQIQKSLINFDQAVILLHSLRESNEKRLKIFKEVLEKINHQKEYTMKA